VRRRRWRDPGDPRRRAIELLGVLLILFGLVAVRLLWVQVVQANRYVAYGDRQRLETIELAAGRGQIFDRNGYDLAITMPQRTVVADPRIVTRPRQVAATLAQLLGEDEEEIYGALSRDSAFAYIARRIPDEVADRIEAENLDGIYFVEEAMRFNPAGDLARSLLGQVGVDNEGLSALELQYDESLSGEPGELLLERDTEGRTIPAGRHRLDPAKPGEDLILTIDRNLQFEAERIMADAVSTTGARGGTAIISDPETGEIYALVTTGLDPETGEPVNSGNNMALTSAYEPGSVNKVITLAAAIEEGLVTPETSLVVPSSVTVADHTFTDPESHLTTRFSVRDILTKSSNVGTIMVAQELGKEKLYDYLRAFGFGERTTLDFPAEVAGTYPEPDDWSGTSIGTIPIGQGISVTSMQMLYAYNAIANDGVYVPPRMVRDLIDADGQRRPGPEGQSQRVVSAQTAAQVREMMANVVAEGTGHAAAIDGYQVAGKTGTARKPSPTGRGYVWDDGRMHYVSTFAGFMPADDPKLSVTVVLDEPAVAYASATAAPTFAELSRYALQHLEIPPSVGEGVGDAASAGSPSVRSAPAPWPLPLAPTEPEEPATEAVTTPTTAPPRPSRAEADRDGG
jgi:cell division protein FtsI (penicillin-binding protein 3)